MLIHIRSTCGPSALRTVTMSFALQLGTNRDLTDIRDLEGVKGLAVSLDAALELPAVLVERGHSHSLTRGGRFRA